MMNRKEIAEKVKNEVVDFFDILEEDYEEDANLVNDFGADSLDCCELLIRAEREFDICVPDEVAVQLQTPREVIDTLEEIINSRP